MRYLKRFAGILFAASFASPSRATTIRFSELPLSPASSSALGVQITPSGPDALPMIQGELEILGATAPYLNNSVASQYYSGSASLDQSATSVSIDVRRAGNSPRETPITLTAFEDGNRVATTTIQLPPLGETARITVSAPAIDQFTWGGSGWVFYPYYLRDLQISFAAASAPGVRSSGPTSSTATPSVGAGVPEPSSIAILTALGLFLSTRRPTRQP